VRCVVEREKTPPQGGLHPDQNLSICLSVYYATSSGGLVGAQPGGEGAKLTLRELLRVLHPREALLEL